MADDLKLHIKQLFSLTRRREVLSPAEKRDLRRRRTESYVGLMNYLRNMMVGYENKEVWDLLTDLGSMMNRKGWFDKILVYCEKLCDIRYNSNIEDEAIAGFDAESEILLDQLTGTSTKKLQIISIAGMAGLGKTTLARKLFKDPLIEYMFDVFLKYTSRRICYRAY